MERTRILRFAAFRIIAARHHKNGSVARRRSGLVEIDPFLQIVGLHDLVANAAVTLDAVHGNAGWEIVGDQHVLPVDINAGMNRTPAKLDHGAVRRQLTSRCDMERREIVLVAGKSGPPRARRYIKVAARGMRPPILNTAWHPHRAAPLEGAGIHINLKMGEIGANARIKCHLVLRSLRKRHPRCHNRASKHRGKRASIEHNFPPRISVRRRRLMLNPILRSTLADRQTAYNRVSVDIVY
jgi:hypothetical protein